jgi:hypothetical protein
LHDAAFQTGKPAPEATDPTVHVNQANAVARVQPVRNGFINAHFSERPSNTIARAQCGPGKEPLG